MSKSENKLYCFFLVIFLALFTDAFVSAQEKMTYSSSTLTSDYLEFRSTDSIVTARGNVVMTSNGTRMMADEIHVHTSSKTANAFGDVFLFDGNILMLSDQAFYDWAQSTGTLINGYVEDPVWRIWGRRIIRTAPNRYRMSQAAVTSCDLYPPHYHFRAWKVFCQTKQRANVLAPSLVLGKSPVLFMPFYTRNLKYKRWALTVHPGHSSYHGYFTESVLIYRLTDNTRARLKWDYFEISGKGYGAEYTYTRPDVIGTVNGYYIKDHVSLSKRWNMYMTHSQQLNARWAVHANGLFVSDSEFNNYFYKDDYYRSRREAKSDMALTYQNPKYTARLLFGHDRVYDEGREGFVQQRTLAPQLSIQTSPLKLGTSGFDLSWNANYKHEYTRPQAYPLDENPFYEDKNLFLHSGYTSLTIRRNIRVTKNITFAPSVGTSQQWRSWRDMGDTIDQADLRVGHGLTGLSFRHRVSRSLDYDLKHTYRVRWTANTFSRDHGALDEGLEANEISFFMSLRKGMRLWATLRTGYDLTKVYGETIKSVRRKTTPPTFDIRFRPVRWASVYYRQTHLLYPARRPQATHFSFSLGSSSDFRLRSGYSYNAGRTGQLRVFHRASFHLTKGWWVDGEIRYHAKARRKANYRAVQITDKMLTIKRDLHCWRMRIELNERPNIHEFFVRLDLKAVMQEKKDLVSEEEKQMYPDREDEY